MHLDPVLIAAIDAGGYISLLKLLPVVVLLGIWAKLLAWSDKDSIAAHLPRELLNSVFFALGMVGFLAFFFLPNFLIALGVLILILAIEVGVYLTLRHQKVGLADLKGEIKKGMEGMGKLKKPKEAKAGQVVLMPKAGAMAVPEADDPVRVGYDAVQLFLTEPLQKNAERVEVRPQDGQNAAVSYVVDGVAYNLPPIPMIDASAGIAFMKFAAGLDIDDKRKPQTGGLKIMMDGNKQDLEVSTAGTTAGETMKMVVNPKQRHAVKFDKLGFSPEQIEQVRGVIAERNGVILVAMPKGQGLSTALYSIMRDHDAFLNHIQTIERAPKEDLEGITQNKMVAVPTPQEEHKQVDWVTSQLPDTIMIDEVISPASAKLICKYITGGENTRSAWVGVRANSAFDAIAAWTRLVGDDQLASSTLRMAIGGRVVRRLCMACKVAYAPDPDTMRKLNMDPTKVETLYQARTQPLADAKGNPIPCEFCHDLRYKGRSGVFEIVPIDEEMKRIIESGGSINQLKNVFRKQKGRYLQEVALMQVQAGETSVQEVLRVLRSDAPAAPGAGPAPGGGPPPGGRGPAPARPPAAKPAAR